MNSDARALTEVAVVIATCGRPALLRRCLTALVEQRGLDVCAYEIVIVDDGRSNDTMEVVNEFARRTAGAPAVRYLRPTGTRGPAAARNRGWRASSAPVIAFTDDDTVPDPLWLANGCRALAQGFAAASGRVVVPTCAAPTDHAKNTQGLETAEFVTANAFVRRDALLRVGGFDERFTRAWREDSDLHFSLIEHYGGVGHAPDAVVVHPVRQAPWGVSLSQQANVYFDALLFKKHRRLYLAKVRHRPPWRYVVVVVASLAAIVAAAAGQARLAMYLFSLSLVVCLAFAWQRLQGTSHAPAHVAEMLLTSLAIPYVAVFWRLRGAWRFKVLFP